MGLFLKEKKKTMQKQNKNEKLTWYKNLFHVKRKNYRINPPFCAPWKVQKLKEIVRDIGGQVFQFW